MSQAAALWGLFTGSFLASTLLPGGSEAALAYTWYREYSSPLLLFAAATAGNTLGGMSSWLIGRVLRRKFPGRSLEKPRHQQALKRMRAYGAPLLLLSWMPVVGDPLCVAAGWLRTGALRSLLYIFAGKGARYALLIYLLTAGRQ